MQRGEKLTLSLVVVLTLVLWCLFNIQLPVRITITAIIGLVLSLWIFWRPFRTIFSRYWQEVLSSLLLLVMLWFLSIKFPTFLFPSILIISVSAAIAILLSTKYVSPKRKTLIFDEDFHDPKYWILNQWGAHCSSISGGQMRFTGRVGPKGEEGSHRDLTNILEVGQIYRIICHVKAELGTTGQFRLWCHDKTRPNVSKTMDVSTGFKAPLPNGEYVSVIYGPYHNPDIRIHLQYKPGKGTIYVDNVRIYEI